MANVSNDSYYATTNTGSALTTAATNIPNIAGPITLGFTVDQYGYAMALTVGGQILRLRDGLCMGDFSDANYTHIYIPVDPLTLPSSSLIGAIAQNTGDIATQPQNWKGGTSYSLGDYVNYYDGNDVTVYECILAISPSTTVPPQDSNHWSYVGKAFYTRLIPGENSLQPGLQQTNRFYHYVKLYADRVDASFLPWYLVVPGKTYTTFAGTAYGLQNAQTFDTSPSSDVTLGLPNTISLTGTVTNTTATFTHSSTLFARLVSGTKVKVRGASGVTVPFVMTITSASDVGFSGTISTTGTYSSTVNYSVGDFVTYTSGGVLNVYYMYNETSVAGVVPTNTTYWTKITGSITGGTVDPIINNWQLYLDTTFFEQTLNPVPAGTTSYSNLDAYKKVNTYAYNDQIINQKQTLFSTGEYIIHDGFPFDKDSIFGGSMNITASFLSGAITPVTTRPSPYTSTAADLPLSDNRWLPNQPNFSSFAYPANTNYLWASYSGGTTRYLSTFNDTVHTYLPDLLVGNTAYNPSGNVNKLKLATPDASIPPLTAVDSLSFKTNDLMYQNTNPYIINGSTANDFTTLIVLYPDFVPSSVMKSTVSGEETNWYGIMSQATQTGVLATDIANWKNYYSTHPRLSVRYKLDGTVGLYLGDALLTAIRPKNGVNRPFLPIIIGLTINASDTSATLVVVDSEIHRSTVKYTKDWKGATPVTPNTMLYGAVPYHQLLHSSKMYVMEINHYYSTQTNAFFDAEIQKMDKMYAITSGRTL